MIVLRNLTKIFHRRGVRKVVVNNLNTVFPTKRSIGLLGRNGAGKSTLLKMIAGTSGATSGEVLTDGTISFPIGFSGSFHPDMTGAQNTRFVARIYGIDADLLAAYVRDFANWGAIFTNRFERILPVCGRGYRSVCRWDCLLTRISLTKLLR
ncbi:MAG: capsular polysaccharide transport system ATP-binding protein [Yoonia sp.]|jgi:capsular polysaccharide transport system ATP-binding protein